MLGRLRKCFRDFQKVMKMTSATEANRCAISARDCDAAGEYLEAYLKLKEKDDRSGTNEFFIHREGLLIAAIVSYSRAFTDSRGEQFATPRARVKLGQVFNNDASKIKLHKAILNRSNKAVAHSDWEYHKTKLLDATKSKGVLRKHTVVIYDKGIDIEMFRCIAATMRDHFQHKAFDRDVASANK